MIGIEGVGGFLKFEDAMKHFPELSGIVHTLVLRWRWRLPGESGCRAGPANFYIFQMLIRLGLRFFLPRSFHFVLMQSF